MYAGHMHRDILLQNKILISFIYKLYLATCLVDIKIRFSADFNKS